LGDAPGCNWITIVGEYESISHGLPGIFISNWMQGLLTIACFGGLIGLTFSFFHPRRKTQAVKVLAEVSWKQLGVILTPFAAAYILLLVYRAASVANDGTGVLFDRYALGLLVIALICLVRYYQDRIDPRLPLAGVVLLVIVAAYGVVITHNTFALYRARVAIAAELRAAGIPDTSTDNGWEYNLGVELQHADYINNPGIALPVHAYIPTPPLPAGTCAMTYHNVAPIIHPLYGVSFDPDACYGPAPFAPVPYSRWPYRTPGALYVVNYRPPSKP
jgi:hypothetical protein